MKKNIFVMILFLSFLTASSLLGMKKEILGYSVQNQEIPIYKFGSGEDVIILIAGMYGDEPKSMALLEKLRTDMQSSITNDNFPIPKSKAIWIIPIINPDGVIDQTRYNANGIDLNRNFETPNWKTSDFYYSIRINCGQKPFSEKETMSLLNIFSSQLSGKNPIVITLFSGGNEVVPGGNINSSKILTELVYNNLRDTTYHEEYDPCGKFGTWLSNKMKIPSVKIKFSSEKKLDITKFKGLLSRLFTINFHKYFNNEKQKTNLPSSDIILTFPKQIRATHTKKKYDLTKLLNFLKLTGKDKELLLLVNKNCYLPSDYAPNDLVQVASIFPATKKSLFLRNILMPNLTKMFEDTKKNSLSLTLVSCYRSYSTQIHTFNYWKKTLGEGEAKKVSAAPGASQHQLGTAIDFNSLYENFGEKPEGKWLLNNSYLYGFVISYPKGWSDVTGYSYEPWHFRYIGKDAAFVVKTYFNNILELFLRWYWKVTTE